MFGCFVGKKDGGAGSAKDGGASGLQDVKDVYQ